ncbi:MAG: hypothetical protein EBY57_00210 [Actinobacteria bacterium]|nr:hypothetical protein [Actinomycetota bacterium]
MNVERLSTVTAMKKIVAPILVLFALASCGDDGPTSLAQKVECVNIAGGSVDEDGEFNGADEGFVGVPSGYETTEDFRYDEMGILMGGDHSQFLATESPDGVMVLSMTFCREQLGEIEILDELTNEWVALD